mmetsp:Transcript_18911/g.55548  ORF Transcript_18911/g.55548 Transcript_18911/m.55548 type:complete len:223 (+) Transcript_18911:624-1292(+)
MDRLDELRVWRSHGHVRPGTRCNQPALWHEQLRHGLRCGPVHRRTLQLRRVPFVPGEDEDPGGRRSWVVDNTLLAELAAVQRAGGLAAQYAGSQALLLRGGCIAGGNMWGYDLGKRALKAHGHEEGPLFHAACSAFSAVTASVLAAPADLVLNRFHAATARGARSPFTSIGACALAVVRNDGVAALFRGVGANFVKMAPTFLGTLPLYEQFRRLAGLGYLQT